MKNSDEAIERVLGGLRDVEAPVGMERRVLAAMEERAAARSGFAWRGWAAGLAAAVVVVGAVVVSMGPRRVEPQSIAVVKVPAVAPVVPSVATVAGVQKRNTGVLTVTAAGAGTHPGANVAVLHYVQNDVHFYQGRKEVLKADEPVASGGIPAPPMPLTEQERLLLHLATHADPQALTPLIAEVRARKDAEFDAEFQEFFAPPEAVAHEKKTDPTNEDKGESR